MRESIGGALLFNIVIALVIIMLGVLISSLAYSKAYKVKNRIIDILEDYGGVDGNKPLDPPIEYIDSVLKELGYNENNGRECIAKKGGEPFQGAGYDYCIERIKAKNGYYYRVSTFMHLDIPIVGTIFSAPISGETKVIYNTYVNIVGE